jgi:glutathione S-transferase
MPMNLGRTGAAPHPEAQADIARIDALWREALTASGGPFLFGAAFGNADAMYAPVVCRFVTYRPDLSPQARAYCEAVRAYPLMVAWYDMAAQEPPEWLLPHYENPA